MQKLGIVPGHERVLYGFSALSQACEIGIETLCFKGLRCAGGLSVKVVKGKAQLGVIKGDHVIRAFGLRKESVAKLGVAFREGT